MRKITSLIMLLVGLISGYAQSAVVGTYNGGVSLTHLTGESDALEDQVLTISETEDGKINVAFPSFAVLGRTETGVVAIEDVAVTANTDGTHSLVKEQFAINVTMEGGMSTSYGYCKLTGTVYGEGDAEITIEVIQNPAMGVALTTAIFMGLTADVVSPIVNAYGGELKTSHLIPTFPETTESDKIVSITKATGSTANITFPSVAVLGKNTGDFTVEGVSVVPNEDGSYTLSKEQFTINVTMEGGMSMSYGYSKLAGTVSAEGNVEITVQVIQNPDMGALSTAVFTGKVMDSSTFVWGQASWNVDDNMTFNGIEEFTAAQVTLAYPNPTGFNLTFLNVIAVEYDLYIDDSQEPIKESSSAQGNTNVLIDYPFAEGHDYRIVTTKALLAQANLATYTTDTLSVNSDSYTISFRINGPELQKTIDVEAYMSLAIIDQNATMTVSKVNVADITSALGISSISEAEMHPLSPNGSYCDHMDLFDWWRDADGEFTNYNGGWNSVAGHNAYPAVYCIKVNEAADSVIYYFYDYWKVYNPDESDTGGGSIVTRAPQTSYNSVIWDWDNGDGTTTQYQRNYRVDEGKDYQSSVMYVANGKSVILRATLHFVSQEEYLAAIKDVEADATVQEGEGEAEYFSVTGARIPALQKGLNIVRYANGVTRKVYVK